MSAYSDGMRALAVHIRAVLNSKHDDAGKLERIRSLVESVLPEVRELPTDWERHDDPEENR